MEKFLVIQKKFVSDFNFELAKIDNVLSVDYFPGVYSTNDNNKPSYGIVIYKEEVPVKVDCFCGHSMENHVHDKTKRFPKVGGKR